MQKPAYRLSLGTQVFDSALIGSDQPLRALHSDAEIGVSAGPRLEVTPFLGKRHDPAHRFL